MGRWLSPCTRLFRSAIADQKHCVYTHCIYIAGSWCMSTALVFRSGNSQAPPAAAAISTGERGSEIYRRGASCKRRMLALTSSQKLVQDRDAWPFTNLDRPQVRLAQVA